MIKHRFSPVGGFATFITVKRANGSKEEIIPNPLNGWLGLMNIGDKITITAVVTVTDHYCYTLDQNKVKTPKKDLGLGTYEKSVTVISKSDSRKGQVAHWPANIMGLTIEGKNFNVGVYEQNGYFYFVIEEYLPDGDKKFAPGEVKWFSLLRGYGAVASMNCNFDLKLHWSSIPRRSNMARFVDSGETIVIKDVVSDITSKSTFFKEIKEMSVI